MQKGKECMKHLIIKNEKGYFLRQGVEVEISEINKDDILALISALIDGEDFEMDQYDSKLLKNPAHNVIYNHLYMRLNDLLTHKSQFVAMSQQTYKDAYQKYCQQTNTTEAPE